MSDSSDSSDSSSGGRGQGSQVRLAVLLVLLLLAVGGLLYDRVVARPACDRAYEKITEVLAGQRSGGGGDETISPEDVQQALERQPRRVEDTDRGIMEVYSWTRGLPWRSYDLYVVYLGKESPVLEGASKNKPPEGVSSSSL